MINDIVTILILSFPVAVIALVYSCILTDADMIMGKPFAWSVTHLPTWLHKPLISCEKCVAGQIAFWSYPYCIIYHYPDFDHLPMFIYYIMQSILSTAILKAVYYAIIQQAPKPSINNRKTIKKPAELL